MNSSGNTTSVEADPYFPLRARMTFDQGPAKSTQVWVNGEHSFTLNSGSGGGGGA